MSATVTWLMVSTTQLSRTAVRSCAEGGAPRLPRLHAHRQPRSVLEPEASNDSVDSQLLLKSSLCSLRMQRSAVVIVACIIMTTIALYSTKDATVHATCRPLAAAYHVGSMAARNQPTVALWTH